MASPDLTLLWPKDRYLVEERERELVAEWMERDAREGMYQYTRMLASMMGLKTFEDWPPVERKAVYRMHPPVDNRLQVTPDVPGRYPQWQMIAVEDNTYFGERVKEYVDWLESGEL